MEILKTDEAQALVAKALEQSGTSADVAETVANALVRAEADGHGGHGLSRVPSYAAQARTGKVQGHAVPVLQDVKPGAFRVDAGLGFSYPALRLAIPELAARAKANGIAVAAIHRSHHFGVAGHHCEDLADLGCAAFIYGNAPKALAPAGATKAILGTNPIAFAAPMEGAPLVIDMAVTTVARGKINAAKEAGEAIPEGWALGPDGQPTTDPEVALKGTIAPMGGAKGAALALMVEVMSACLAGAAFGTEASSLFEGEGAPPNLGQVMIAVDVDAVSGGAFAGRMVDLAAIYAELEGVRMPGSRRLEARARAEREGLAIKPAILSQIRDLAGGSQ